MKLTKYSYLMMIGHICADTAQGALPAMLPFLVAQGNISYASASGLVFATSAVSSLIQPVFGYLGDRSSKQWLMALGVFLSGLGLAAMGYMDHYWQMFAVVAVSGAGVALFHPEGGKTANIVAGNQKGMGMGLFGAGGNIGFTIGPVIASAAMVAFGLKGTAVFIIPGLIVAIIFLASAKNLKRYMRLTALNESEDVSEESSREKNDWPSFVRAVSSVFMRSIVNYGLFVFIPLYWVSILGQSKVSGSIKLTLMAVVGVAATVGGGMIADRFGFVPMIRAANIIMFPFMLALVMTDNVVIATLLLIPIAVCNSAPYSAMIALSQSFLPKSIGLASGITLGLSVSVGGMFSPVLGKVADACGLHAAMYLLLALAAAAIAVSFILPPQKDR